MHVIFHIPPFPEVSFLCISKYVLAVLKLQAIIHGIYYCKVASVFAYQSKKVPYQVLSNEN